MSPLTRVREPSCVLLKGSEGEQRLTGKHAPVPRWSLHPSQSSSVSEGDEREPDPFYSTAVRQKHRAGADEALDDELKQLMHVNDL